MRVRYKTICAGPEGVFYPGAEAEAPDAEGRQLVEGGYAEDLTPPAPSPRTPPEGQGTAPEGTETPPEGTETPPEGTKDAAKRRTRGKRAAQREARGAD